jgi:hypothetical protein
MRDAIRNERVSKLLDAALEGGETRDLVEALIRVSGTPGPRPNMELARAVGATLAGAGKQGVALGRFFLEHDNEYCVRIGLAALAARASDPKDKTGALATLHDRSDEPKKPERDAVIEALVSVIVARGDGVVPELAKMTDGFLHAYVALEALTSRQALDRLTDHAEVLARLTEAFDLADQSSRSAERSQGVRLLREGLPEHIARIAARFPEAMAWIQERLSVERPESREVLRQAIVALRKRSIGDAETARLVTTFESHDPKPRDPTRVIKGMRRRGKLR